MIEAEERTALRRAVYQVLLAMVRIMVRCGIGQPEFSEICKKSFVTAASRDTTASKASSTSQIALATGLSRKEVKRIRGTQSVSLDANVARSPAAKLLHYWYTEPEFLDALRQPKALPLTGHDQAFDTLVKRVAGDVPVGALRTALLRAGAVQECGDGSLRAVKRYFVPGDVDEKILEGLNFGFCNLIDTIAFNTTMGLLDEARFQREVHSPHIPAERLDEIRLKLQKALEEASIELDDFLAQFERTGTDEEHVDVGVGIYYVDEDMPTD
jgi:hypothetical protein